jgi:hypothetical protein
MLPTEALEMRKYLLSLSLAKEKWNAKATV